MPNILTVDDSKAIRTLVSRQMQALGCDIAEAENGEEGLQKLEEMKFDLVLLDVTMPVLDGPGMLKRMREQGNNTPVIMLTSESKTSIIGEAMRLGISDYILKPFRPEEIREKACKVLKLSAAANDVVKDSALAAPAEVRTDSPLDVAARPFVDILSIDDMENVHKKLRTLLPVHVTFNSCANAHAALALCREKVYRCVLVDTTLPDIDSVALMHQMRALQPHANFLAMPLRTVDQADKVATGQGFKGVLFKPFDPEAVSDFLARFFDNQELVSLDGDVVKLAAFHGKEDRARAYFDKAAVLICKAIDDIAAACFEDVVLDVSDSLHKDRSPRLVIEVERKAQSLGLQLKLVGTAEAQSVFKQFVETASVPFYLSTQDAKAA